MNKNVILYCDTCGEMKKITYKYDKNNLIINCECIKERKKRNHPIELFLNNNYKAIPLLKCNQHNSSFVYWCDDCKINICEKCSEVHSNHKRIKLTLNLIYVNEINNLEKKVKEFEEKLQQKKKIVEEKHIFNQKEEKEFFANFNKYYNLNIQEIAFVRFIKEQYQYLVKNNIICYQIIINLKYLLEKLNFFLVNNVFSSSSNKEIQKDEEITDLVEIYNMVFKFEHYCLLPNNDNEENEKKAEEMQNNINLERSNVINMDTLSEVQAQLNFNEFFKDIPISQSVNLLIPNQSVHNSLNNISNNNKIQSNENEKINNSESLINSTSESNFFLLNSQTVQGVEEAISSSGDKYTGTYKNGKYDCDNARLIYSNGFVYEGSFKNGLRNGIGTLTNPNNTYMYNGGWLNDKKHGKCLEIINGETFEGNYKEGIREGKCSILYSNQDKFVGNLSNGKKEGYGEQFCYSTGSTYKGNFRNNLFEGLGTITNDNGYYYEGGFLGGLRHGDKCKEMKKGVREYEGEFRRDKMNGKGEYKWYQGESKGDIYNGEFKDDLFDGFGTYKYSDGTIYIGEFKRGIKDGKGKTIYSDGSFHEGEYRDGHQSGKGLFQDMEGNIYEGNFYNGNKHSKGKITFNNGEILEGLWLNGMKEGNFIFIDSKGDKYNRKYNRDELVEEQKENFFTSVFNGIFEKISNLIK